MERSNTIWVALIVASFGGVAYAGPSAECLSAQEDAKRRIQQEQLRVASEEDGIYGSAVKMRRIYRITLDAITGVCPQGAVDYYQRQHDIAMRSACQSSAMVDTLCQEESARQQEAEYQEQQAPPQPVLTEAEHRQQCEAAYKVMRQKLEAALHGRGGVEFNPGEIKVGSGRYEDAPAAYLVMSQYYKAQGVWLENAIKNASCPNVPDYRETVGKFYTSADGFVGHSNSAVETNNKRAQNQVDAAAESSFFSDLLGVIGAVAVGAASGYVQGQAIQQQYESQQPQYQQQQQSQPAPANYGGSGDCAEYNYRC